MTEITDHKRKVVLVSIISITFVLGAVAIPKLPQLITVLGGTGELGNGLVQPLEADQPVLEEIRIGRQGLDFVFKVPVHNPNFYPAHVESVKGDLYVGERKVSQQSTFEGTQIPAGTTENVTLKVNSRVEESLKATPQIVFNKLVGRETRLNLDGVLEVKVG